MSLVITTGTGSGKTESFLLPIMAKLAIEAQERPASFQTPAIRALLLYPMNALVNDQLARLRLLFGDPRVAAQFTAWSGRPARFARYTSRTLYPGVRTAKKDSLRLKSIETFYITLLEAAENPDSAEHEQAAALVSNLQKKRQVAQQAGTTAVVRQERGSVEESSRGVCASGAASGGR